MIQIGSKSVMPLLLTNFHYSEEFGVCMSIKSKHTNGMFFIQIRLRYMLTKHVIANISLLTHFAKSDYFEGGFGYEF